MATRTGGRAAITGLIRGRYSLSVGRPHESPPDGWRWELLSDLARLESGHTPSRKRADYWDGPIPWIGIRDATSNHGRTLDDTQQHVTELGIEKSSARVLPANTVCLSRTASVGYVVVMGRPMATSQDFVNWVCSDDLDYRFLKYLLLAEHETYLSFASGTTHQTIYFPEVKAFHVCLPAIEQQRKIADVLQSIDDLIENNRRRIEVLEEMAQAIYREWFVQFRYPGHEDATFVDSPLGPIPADWEYRKTQEFIDTALLEIGDGYRAKNVELTGTDTDLPFVRVANVRYGALELDGCDFLPFSYVHRLKGKTSRPGDSVISMKGTVGRAAYVNDDMRTLAYSPQVSYWRSLDFERIAPTYIYAFVRSDAFVEQCAVVKGATDMADYVNLTDQRNMKLVIPAAGTMKLFDETAGEAVRLARRLHSAAQTLTTVRDLLLPKLVTGEIDVSTLDLDALAEAV